MTDFKSFKINIAYLERENILNFEIYFKNRLIIKENAFYIDIPTLKEGIVNDVGIESKKPIIVTGCGHFGCCPGLFWKLVHEDELIKISDVHWSGKPEEYRLIEGEFRVKLDDYRSEVLNLEKKLKNLISPKLYIALRKQGSPLSQLLE